MYLPPGPDPALNQLLESKIPARSGPSQTARAYKPLFQCLCLFISPDNTSFVQIVGRKLYGHFIPWKDSDKIHAEFSADMS